MSEHKTALSPQELETYRNMLLEKRLEVMRSLDGLQADARDERRPTTSGQELSDIPTHPADVGTDVFERDMDERLKLEQLSRLREIDAALRRIEDGTYGICQADGEPISPSRLRAKPWAAFCLQHADMQSG